MSFRTSFLPSAAALVAILSTACSDTATSPMTATGSTALVSKGGSGGGGGGGGGKTPEPPAQPSPLPTTAPAPGVLLRESFGVAAGQRPNGDNGTMRDAPLHTTLNDFWVEYPGSKGTQWITSTSGQTWKFAGCSINPFEMPSPLQTAPANGCIASEWFDPVTSYPTALTPFTPPTSGYEISMEGWPSPITGGYIAIGFTNSAVLTSNLTSVGSLWLRVQDLHEPAYYNYELRTGGMNGAVLATGKMIQSGFSRLAIRYTPSTSSVTLTIAGEVVGTFHATIATPSYVAFEGVGILDDFVVRQ